MDGVNTALDKTTNRRPALGAMYAGLVLTVGAMVAPYVDRSVLADHIRDGYPTYSTDRIDTAVTAWLVILSVIGALGVVSWIATIWAVRAGKGWACWAATVVFAAGTSLALTTLLVKDTSGEVGLAPVLGLIGLLPCVAGLLAVAMLWRRA
jgi:cytochrome bd-type quinol oxidase subunit 2